MNSINKNIKFIIIINLKAVEIYIKISSTEKGIYNWFQEIGGL